jgi:toxin YoeB
MNITFHQSAFADYQQWANDDIKIFTKINNLIKEITRTPFTGTGKHRIIYKVEQNLLIVAACKFHYADK